MGIHEDDVKRVADNADIVPIIQRRVDLKKSGGGNWKGLCPFHSENTPSFSVSQDKGVYHCFGCKESGNVFTFLEKVEGMDFVTAVEQLAETQGVQLRYVGGTGNRAARDRNKHLTALLGRAASYYHEQLLTAEAAGKARAYLRGRGYDKDIVVKYQLGYAPPGRSQLASALLGEEAEPKATPELLQQANLIYIDEPRGGGSGGHTDGSGGQATEPPNVRDRFYDRVMFPIRDATGNTVGFGGRMLPEGRNPKYLNSAQTQVYDKSRVLYGLDTAKRAIAEHKFVLICEGYTDVIGFSIAGFDNAVATCGTALTEQHVQQLVKSTNRILLAFDSDTAGKSAAERFHQWERKYELEVAVVELPEGQDPDQLAISDPEALHKAVADARKFYLYRADQVFARHDLSQPIARGRAADELAKVMAVYPADLISEADVAPLAQRLPMETADFMARIASAREQLAVDDQAAAANAAARSSGRAAGRGAQSDYAGPDYAEPGYSGPDDMGAPPEFYPDESHSSSAAGSRVGSSAGSSAGTRRGRSAAVRVPMAEIEALQAFGSLDQENLTYVVPEMFDHAVTRDAFEALSRQREGVADSGESQQALAAYEQACAEALDAQLIIPQDELSEENKLKSLSAAMAAAIDRKSRQLASSSQIRTSIEFRERVVPELLETVNPERIRELLAEGVEWLRPHRD